MNKLLIDSQLKSRESVDSKWANQIGCCLAFQTPENPWSWRGCEGDPGSMELGAVQDLSGCASDETWWRTWGIPAVFSGSRPRLQAAVVLILGLFLSLSGNLAAEKTPLPHPSKFTLDQSVFSDPGRTLPECRPVVPETDPGFTIVSVDGAVLSHETSIAVREGFFAARRRLEKWWVQPEDFVFIAHPIQITEPQTGFWCAEGLDMWCGGYYEYRPHYQEFGKPEIHFVSDYLNPGRVRALVDHEASHGVAHLAGCPNWYTIGHDGTDVCF